MTYVVLHTKETFADDLRSMSCFQQTHVSEVDRDRFSTRCGLLMVRTQAFAMKIAEEFNDAVSSTSGYTVSRDRTLLNKELERIWKKTDAM